MAVADFPLTAQARGVQSILEGRLEEYRERFNRIVSGELACSNFSPAEREPGGIVSSVIDRREARVYILREYIRREYFTGAAMPDRSDVRDDLPLTTVVFQIMLALADGQRHGYGVMLEVEERTGGAVSLRPGTLYRALNRMLESGWVEEAEDRPDPELDDERRRYYRLTGLGRRVAAAEARRLAREVEWARDKKLLRPREA